MFFCQKNAALAAQKELSEKIEKYQYIDTLSSKDYLHYSISIKEGNIEMFDKIKKNTVAEDFLYILIKQPQSLKNF